MLKQFSPRHIALSAIVALAAAGVTSPAMAGPTAEVPSKVVRFGDLDLTKQEGIVALYGRIKSAARSVCADGDASPWALAETRRCYSATLSKAVTEADIPMLSALHGEETNHYASK